MIRRRLGLLVGHQVGRGSLSCALAIVGAWNLVACTTLGGQQDKPTSEAPALTADTGTEARPAAAAVGTAGTPERSAVAQTELAVAADDREAVTRPSRFAVLDVPGVGLFYLPASVTRDLRGQRAAARVRLKDHPQDPWALRTLATYEIAVGNPFGAKAFIDIARSKGLGMEPESSLIMGLACLAMSDEACARDEFARAESTNEGYILSQINQGMNALNGGRASQAVSHFSGAALRDGRNVVARLHLGQAYYLLRMHTQALRQFDEAIAIDPANSLALFNRGIVLHRGLREFERARDSFESVLAVRGLSSLMRKKAIGALRNLDRDAQGRDSLATIGAF